MMNVKSRAKPPKAKEEEKPLVPGQQEAPKPKKKVYYSVNSRQCFSVPTLGSDGKVLIAKNKRGEERYIGGEPVLIDKTVIFTTISHNATKGLLSLYETSDKQEIEILDKLAIKRDSDILSEEEYQRSRNKEAFDFKVKSQGLEEENKSLKTGKEAAEKKISDLQTQVSDLSKKP